MQETATAGPASKRTALLGWLLLLPAAVLAWPAAGAPLVGDPYPHLAASALTLIAALPAALYLLALPGRPVHGLLLFTTIWALVALGVGFGGPDDLFEARRTLAHFTALAVAFLGGALLDARGREVFLRGVIGLSVGWSGGAFLLEWTGAGHLAGVLGDTGSLSQAALPGAVVGAWFLALRSGTWKVLGLGAVLLTIAHASRAPVIGAGGALVLTLLLCALVSPWAHERARVRRRFGICAALAVFALIALRGAGGPGEAEPAAARTSVPTDLGGIEVRLDIWGRLPTLLASTSWMGVGPGQFQARFPPFRDPREIEASRHGVCSELTTEVEHAHNDYLEGLVELGLAGGAFWLAFLALAGVAAWRGLRQQELAAAAAGSAALALLLNGLFHAPLFVNTPAAFLGFALFGLLLSGAGTPVTRALRTEVALAVGLAILAFGGAGVRHGRALARQDFAAALRAEPASTSARMLQARSTSSVADWESALRRRPHAVEALEQLGVLHARRGRPEAARAYLLQALALSPTHPRILRNLIRLDFRSGDTESGRRHLDHLRATGCLGSGWPAELGEELVLAGELAGGVELLLGIPLGDLVPEELKAEATVLEAVDPRRARALDALAHLLWARDHVSRQDPASAVRSYRQAWNATRRNGQDAGAACIRLEMAAAELLAGRRPELEQHALEGLEALPAWARDALLEAGFGPGG